MAFTKGDILLPTNKLTRKKMLSGLFHPAVVWDDFYNGQTDFHGIMLTHSPPTNQFANILMLIGHFENGHSVVFSNTHFVNQIFVKFHDWGPFELAGKLTTGIAFIQNHLNTDSPPQEFSLYQMAISNSAD